MSVVQPPGPVAVTRAELVWRLLAEHGRVVAAVGALAVALMVALAFATPVGAPAGSFELPVALVRPAVSTVQNPPDYPIRAPWQRHPSVDDCWCVAAERSDFSDWPARHPEP